MNLIPVPNNVDILEPSAYTFETTNIIAVNKQILSVTVGPNIFTFPYPKIVIKGILTSRANTPEVIKFNFTLYKALAKVSKAMGKGGQSIVAKEFKVSRDIIRKVTHELWNLESEL